MFTKLPFVISQEQLSITQGVLVPSHDLVESPVYILMEKQTPKIWGKKSGSSSLLSPHHANNV